ncbi:NAD-dependent epimerase [Candidatus Woesearchaeota archaeon]|nr:NAD-dependent epimerase [Candidatus Woesearchaeota archaeon]
MKILVTGAAGFIGFHVSQALLARGDDVVGIDSLNDYYDVNLKKARLTELLGKKGFAFVEKDLADKEAMEAVFKEHKPDKICHLAAQAGVRYSLENPFAYEHTNIHGTLVLLEMCRHHGVKDFIYASSSSVYGNNKKVPFAEEDPVDHPISLYAASKKTCELMAYTYHHLFGLNCTGLRFFTVYGPWGRPDMALFKFTKATIEGKPIDVYNHGKMKRDFTYIDDITAGVLAALDKAYPYEIFNLGGDHPVELEKYIECIEKAIGRKAKRNNMPMQPGDVPITMADLTKSRKMLGFDPKTQVEEGIPKFIDWYKKFYDVK